MGILSVVFLFAALSMGNISALANELSESNVKIYCSATMDDNFTGYWGAEEINEIAGIRFSYNSSNHIKIWREIK